MARRICKLVIAVALVGFLGGCLGLAAPIEIDTAGVPPVLDYSDLASVLKKVVTSSGLVIPTALKAQSETLDRQLAVLALTGPNTTPELLGTDEDRLAYWYNARTAWAMKLAIVRDFPAELPRAEVLDQPFPLDSRVMSLREIDEILEADEDWRALVASPGVTLLRCPLPAQPFSSDDIRTRITERFNAFVDDERRFVIDVANRQILVPPVLWSLRQRLIEEHHKNYQTQGANLTTALLPHVRGSPHRRLQDAIGYEGVPVGSSLLLGLFEKD